MFARRLSRRTRGGFSLIEMLVSIAIIMVISAVVLMRYSAFNSVVLLRSLAYEVALSLREAQTLGVSVRGYNQDFKSGYGVHFSIASNDATARTSYRLFVDGNIPPNERYDGSHEELLVYSIGRGNVISRLCVMSGTTEDCSLTTLDVTFRRPDPDARFYTNAGPTNSVRYASIHLSAPDGNTRIVRVYPTGQISVE